MICKLHIKVQTRIIAILFPALVQPQLLLLCERAVAFTFIVGSVLHSTRHHEKMLHLMHHNRISLTNV